MKQNITAEQFKELSAGGRKKLRGWYSKKYVYKRIPGSVDGEMYSSGYYFDPELSIGQMIEFLDERKEAIQIENESIWVLKTNWDAVGETFSTILKEKELCDALWDAVKEVLEEKKI